MKGCGAAPYKKKKKKKIKGFIHTHWMTKKYIRYVESTVKISLQRKMQK